MFFVAGITGKVGGAAARHLLSQGHSIRGLARDPAKAADWSAQGVDIRQGDFTDASAMADALHGVEGAFVMVPPVIAPEPGYPESKAVIAGIAAALGRSPVARVVALSSIGSEKTSGLGLITATHLLEEALRGLAPAVGLVRAGCFLENFIPGLMGARESGVFYSIYGPVEHEFPMIATDDIGREIARLLTGNWTGEKVLELGSPVSPNGVAAAMTEVLGREVKAQAIPQDRLRGVLESFGVPAGRTIGYEEMVAGFNSGWIDFGVAGTESVAGTTSAVEVYRKAVQG